MAAAQFFAYEDLTVSTVAVGGTAATYLSANYAFISCESAVVRFAVSAVPTATSGIQLFPGDTLVLENADEVAKIKFISRDGASATLRINYGVK